jgi:hypothetical protein
MNFMILLSDKVDENKWNNTVAGAGVQGTIFQTTYWAEFMKKSYRDRPIYVTALDKKGNIQGLLLALESCYAKHPSLTQVGKPGFLFGQLFRKTVAPVFHRILPFIYWENGPITISQLPSEKSRLETNVYRGILAGLLEKAQQLHCYEVKFGRSAFFNDEYSLFSSLGFSARRMGTFLVSLDHPIELVWNRLDKHCRRNIRKIEQDIEIRQVRGIDGLRAFYDMHIECSKRLETKTYPFSFFVSLWNHFSQSDKLVIFLAYMKDMPLSAILCLAYNKTAHEYFVADSKYARDNRIYANDVLKWHALKWACQEGFAYFDLSGVELHKIDAGDTKAKNIYQFKSKWGGQLVEFHDYKRTFCSPKILKILNHFLVDSL